MVNKRYKDIFAQYIHRGEKTPFTLGTLTIVALCFLFLIVATFSKLIFAFPKLSISSSGIELLYNEISYSPFIPAIMFAIYILGKKYSYLLFIIYLITGFFIWPIFVFGGGIDYAQNYLFGYSLGFLFAIIFAGNVLKRGQDIKSRAWCAVVGVFSIHITGFLYCFILALFKVIEFNMIVPIAGTISGSKIVYDIIFSVAILVIAPYIKNIFWICMKPKLDRPKLKDSLKNARIRSEIIRNNID